MLDMAIMTKGRKLAIECDGEAYHSGREKAVQDRRRDNALSAGAGTCCVFLVARFGTIR